MGSVQDDRLMLDPLHQHPNYEALATLPGIGKSQLVQVARHRRTGNFVMIKFLRREYDADTATRLVRATINHMELSTALHPHILIYKETFLTPHYLAKVTEYIEGETMEVFLEKVGGKVIEGLARFVFQQLAIAVDYCHKCSKILRDIKLGNILLSICEGQLPLLKLCDFSVSKDLGRDVEPHAQDGSILYAAPEVLQNACGGCYDGRAADIWSCGVILYVMLFGRHPFMRDQDSSLSQEQRMLAILQRTMRGDAEYPTDVAAGISPACLDLISKLLQPSPTQRVTMREVMQHPWFFEALPDGALAMNRLFLVDTRTLGASDVSSVQALIRRASSPEPPEVAPAASPSAAASSRAAAGAVGGVGPTASASGSHPGFHAQLLQEVVQPGEMGGVDAARAASSSSDLSGVATGVRPGIHGLPGAGAGAGVAQAQGDAPGVAVQEPCTPGGEAAPPPPPSPSGVALAVAAGQGQGQGQELLTFVATPLMPQQHMLPSQQDYQQQQSYQLQLLQAGANLVQSGIVLRGGGGSGGGAGLEHGQGQGVSQDSLMKGLMELEDALMEIPSSQLKAAAISDVLRQSFNIARFDSFPSPVASRTISELERALLGSPSFVREFIQAGAAGAAGVDLSGLHLQPHQHALRPASSIEQAAAAALAAVDSEGLAGDRAADARVPATGSGSLADTLHYLYDPNDDDPMQAFMPHVSFSAMCGSFNRSFNKTFESFNKMFVADGGDAGDSVPLTPPEASAWARICQDANVRVSEPPVQRVPAA